MSSGSNGVQINVRIDPDSAVLLERVARKLLLGSRTAAARFVLEHARPEVGDEVGRNLLPDAPDTSSSEGEEQASEDEP
jgi:hypothetical protein